MPPKQSDRHSQYCMWLPDVVQVSSNAQNGMNSHEATVACFPYASMPSQHVSDVALQLYPKFGSGKGAQHALSGLPSQLSGCG